MTVETREASDSTFYFAYGSNADAQRFCSRVGRWRSMRPAWLHGYRLRFADSVRSEGGGGAVVDRRPDSRVAGVLYEITQEQLSAMDREEFDPRRDTSGAGRRVTVTVEIAEGPVRAQMYNVRDDGEWRAPSNRYLTHILRGLEGAGHGPDVLEGVLRAAGCDPR